MPGVRLGQLAQRLGYAVIPPWSQLRLDNHFAQPLFGEEELHRFKSAEQLFQAAIVEDAARGRRVIVAFPNFGHWSVRLSMLFSGRAPRTKLFPYEWYEYESPNIHFLTVHDFEALAEREGLLVERRIFLAGHRKVTALPNLLAEVPVFLVQRHSGARG